MTYVSDQLISGLDAAGALSLDDLIVLQQDGDTILTASDLTGLVAFLFSVLFSPVITDSTSNRDISETDGGKYIRFTNASPKTATFIDEGTDLLPDDIEFHIRCVDADLTLTPFSTDTIINPPAGGTLVLEDGMTVTVKRVALNEFDVIGQTVPA